MRQQCREEKEGGHQSCGPDHGRAPAWVDSLELAGQRHGDQQSDQEPTVMQAYFDAKHAPERNAGFHAPPPMIRLHRRGLGCGEKADEGVGRGPGGPPHGYLVVRRPERSSRAFGSGSRPMKVRYSSAGSWLSPRARMFSRKRAPTSRLKMPLSWNRV